jgi:hypothetical protein
LSQGVGSVVLGDCNRQTPRRVRLLQPEAIIARHQVASHARNASGCFGDRREFRAAGADPGNGSATYENRPRRRLGGLRRLAQPQ